MSAAPPRPRAALAALGMLAVASGLLCNDLTYTFFFTPSLYAPLRTEIAIWILDLALVLGGIVLIRRSRVQWAMDAALAVVVTVALLLLVEGSFAALHALTAPSDVYEGNLFTTGHEADPRVGDKPRPNMRLTHIRRIGGQAAYDVSYTIDEHSRRVTPQANLAARDRFALFFGCSYTFGIGVEDDQTMPFDVAEAAPEYHVYNYGYGGYGPNQMLAQLQNDGLRAEVAEASGIAVYTFIDHHVDRANGRSDALWGPLWDGPYFTLDDGRLINGGGFRWGRPVLSFINYAVSRSHTAGYFKRSFPPVTDASLDLTARIITAARDDYAAKFGNDDFYVVFYPNSWRASAMIARLAPAGVKVLDYSRLFQGRNHELFIPNDRHPTAEAHRIVARQLATDLGIAAPPAATE